MSTLTTYPLRLPKSIKAAAERLSKADGTSLNQFVATAVAEKIAVMETTAFFEARDELVWEWRYCDGGNLMAKFDVLFDATTRQVRTSFSRPDYRGPEGVVPTCGQVYGR